MTIAYSLIRFSTKGQADGDSFRRQNGPTVAFCEKHGLELDTSLHESDVRRLGVSAFKGEHIRKGPLGKFIRLVEAGKVAPGSWLVVEEIDRLTRQVHDQAYDLCLTLMRRGITIATMMDGEVYDIGSINGSLEKRLKLMLRLDAAHEYSAKLSNRINSVWEGRREAMRAGNGSATNACPAWLRAVDGKFVQRADRVAIVKRIIAERHLGLGRQAVSTRLNQDGVKTFRGGDGWHPSTIAALVKNPALIGIYQPRKADGTPDGDPIRGFYPRIISDDDFWLAQWGPDNKGPRGRKTKGLANLLSEVCHCGRCGAGLIYLNTGKDAFLVCGKARRGMCDNRYHRTYAKLETELLSALGLFDFSRLLDRADPQVERIAAIEAEISAKTATVDRLLEDFSTSTPAAVSKRIGVLSAEVEALTAELAQARGTARIAEAEETRDAYADFRAMVDSMPAMPEGEERYQLRTKIAGELRRLIETATATGTELAIRFRGAPPDLQIELIVERSRLVELRLVENETGDHFVFSRAQIFHDSGFNPAGQFEAFITRRSAKRPKARDSIAPQLQESIAQPYEDRRGHAHLGLKRISLIV
jgi:DNA invertase Pin-like site-specific DNA recombinase